MASWEAPCHIPEESVEAAFQYELRRIGNGAVDGRRS